MLEYMKATNISHICVKRLHNYCIQLHNSHNISSLMVATELSAGKLYQRWEIE